MSGVILTFLERPETAATLLSAAQHLAGLAGAKRINGLVVRRPPIDTIMPTEEILSHKREARIREREHRRADAIKAQFDGWAAAASGGGLVADWVDVEAGIDRALGDHGSRADAIVLEQPSPRAPDMDRQPIHVALFDCERPVLVVPEHWRPAPFGRHVAVAWRNDPRTVKAVLAALRWFGQAERIDIIEGLRDGAAPSLPEIFEEHGVPAALHALPLPGHGPFGAVLLAQAHALGADMLVMGAFAHSPLRELLLGGVTRYMLTHADLPVLMRH